MASVVSSCPSLLLPHCTEINLFSARSHASVWRTRVDPTDIIACHQHCLLLCSLFPYSIQTWFVSYCAPESTATLLLSALFPKSSQNKATFSPQSLSSKYCFTTSRHRTANKLKLFSLGALKSNVHLNVFNL